jgi:hypothetical protein
MPTCTVTISTPQGSAGPMEDVLRKYPEYPHHRQALMEESGIDPTVVAGRGYRTVKTKAELARLGFGKPQRR